MELTRQEERYNDPLIKLKDIILWDLHEIEDCSFGIMLCVSEHRFKNNFLLQTVQAISHMHMMHSKLKHWHVLLVCKMLKCGA